MTFVVAELKVYRLAQPEKFRLFRPNVPEISASERWYHFKINHSNPDALVKARPHKLSGGGIWLYTRGGEWNYSDTLGAWVFEARPVSEAEVEDLDFSQWTPGRYRGELPTGYRKSA